MFYVYVLGVASTRIIMIQSLKKLRSKAMNGLLSIIGMKTEMEYQMSDFPFGLPRIRFNVPKGNIPSDKQKCQPKAQHEFTIKGIKIMAASKKDAIKKYNHRKK